MQNPTSAKIWPLCIFLLSLLSMLPPAHGQSAASNGQPVSGGATCVIAKKLGDSLAIEWVTSEPSVTLAIEKAKRALRKKGHEYVFPQSSSNALHGWMAIIQTRYRTYTGRERTSYGCGFSSQSSTDAEAKALINLRTYSWGWKESMGYKIIEQRQY